MLNFVHCIDIPKSKYKFKIQIQAVVVFEAVYIIVYNTGMKLIFMFFFIYSLLNEYLSEQQLHIRIQNDYMTESCLYLLWYKLKSLGLVASGTDIKALVLIITMFRD